MYEALVQTGPGVKFGIAFCEASGERLVRWDGNDSGLIELAQKNALEIGCGHTFIIFMKDMFPVNCLDRIKHVPEVCRIFCATANPLQVIVAKTDLGRGNLLLQTQPSGNPFSFLCLGVVGVIDGQPPLRVETEKDQEKRKDFLRMTHYKR